MGEKDRKRDRVGERNTGEKERERDTGEKEKNYKHRKFMEFYLVVLHSAERSEARQVSCYSLLSCFNPVTRIFIENYLNSKAVLTFDLS